MHMRLIWVVYPSEFCQNTVSHSDSVTDIIPTLRVMFFLNAQNASHISPYNRKVSIIMLRLESNRFPQAATDRN